MRYQTAYRQLLCCIVLLCCSLSAAYAQWSSSSTTNTAVATYSSNKSSNIVMDDGTGGTYVAWTDRRNGGGGNIYLQRLDANGMAQWQADGIQVQTNDNPSVASMVSDGAGGVIIAFGDTRNGNWDVFAQRFNSAGTAMWTANGVSICTATDTQGAISVTADGSNGAIITWDDWRAGSHTDIYAQRVNASGVVQWTADGVAVCSAASFQFTPKITTDGSGGAILTWQDYRSGDNIYAQRLNASGVPQWTANGVPISSGANNTYGPQIASDGSGGAYIAWPLNGAPDFNIYVQRVNASGVALWTANGVQVSTDPEDENRYSLKQNGTSGVFVGWITETTRQIKAQYLNTSGAIQWTAGGVTVCNATGNRKAPQIDPDGSGGIYMAWSDERDGTADIYAQRLNAAGAAQWTANGIVIANAANNQTDPMIASNASTKKAVVVFLDTRTNPGGDIYAQQILQSGLPVAVPAITSFTPATGPVGTSVTINGTGFDATAANNIVYFGAVGALVTHATTTSITVTVPTGATAEPITLLNTTTHLSARSRTAFITTYTGSQLLGKYDLRAPLTLTTISSQPIGLHSVDLDGDGKPELCAIDGQTLMIFRNTASSGTFSGAFAAKQSITLPATVAGSLVAGDIDGDGKQDLVINNYISNSIYILRNTSTTGAVSFAATVSLSAGMPYRVVLTDADGDGQPDLAAMDISSSQINIFRNIATPGNISPSSFEAAVSISLPSGSAGAFSAADIDGDGKEDLLATSGDQKVYVFRNIATAGTINSSSFAAAVSLSTFAGASPERMKIGDIDGDGKPDITVIAYAASAKVSIFRNKSTAGAITLSSFETRVDYDVPSYPFHVSIGDLNGDAKPEIVLSCAAVPTIYMMQNISTPGTIDAGSFTATIDLNGANNIINPYSTTIVDIDGDGRNDLGYALYNGLSLMRNNPPLVPTTQVTNISFTQTTTNSTTISWTRGNGDECIVLLKTNGGNAFPTVPDGTDYTANTIFGLGSQVTGNWYVVYTGTGNSVNVSNLQANHYTVAVLERSGKNGYSSAAPIKYLNTTATGNPAQVYPKTTLTNITRVGLGAPTNASSVEFDITFTYPPTGISVNNLGLTTTGTISGATVTSLTPTGSPTVFRATVGTGTGSGDIGLQFTNSTGMAAGISNALPYTGASHTIDKDPPVIGVTSIGSNNALSSSLAKQGDVITVSMPIPVDATSVNATINGNTALVTGSGGLYRAQLQVTGATPEGPVTFSMTVADNVGNTATTTAATNGATVVVDRTAPIAGNISITSSNANPALAKAGDKITVQFTSNEPLSGIYSAALLGRAPTIVNTTGNVWTASITVTASDVEGNVPFVIYYADRANNAGSPVIGTTDNSSVRTDRTAPAINSIVIASNNTNTGRAVPGNIVTLNFTTNETVTTPQVTIATKAATITNTGGNNWQATYTMTATDNEGTLPFTIRATDLAGNTSATATGTTNASSVVFDITAPTIGSITIASGNSYAGKARTGNTVTLKFTSSEAITTPVVTIATNAATITNTGGNNWQATYSMKNTDTEGIVPFTIRATDLAGNASMTATETSNTSKVVFDKTAPALNSIKRQLPATANVTTGPVTYRASFGEPVMGVLKSKFTLTKTATANASIDTVIAVNDSTYDVRLANLSGAGNLRLDLTGFATVTDSTGNAMASSFTTGENYTIINVTNGNSAPVFEAGANATFAICQDAALFDLSSLLKTADADNCQSLTWTISSAPSHGTLGNFPATATSNGASVAPQNAGYSPAAGYNGTDRFTIAVTDGTATNSITIDVTVNPLPATTIAAAQGAVLCGTNATLPLTIASGAGFAWTKDGLSVGSNTSQLTVNAPGTYTAVVTDANGCAARTSNSIVVTTAQQPKAAFTTAGYCVNIPVAITNQSTGAGTVSYSWSDGNGNTATSATPAFTYTQPGTYHLKLKVSSSVCAAKPDSITQPITIERPAAALRMNTISTQVLQATPLQARGFGVSYQWSPATDLSNATLSNPVLRPRSEQQYTVSIRSAAGCVTVDTLLVKVFDNNVYVPKVFTPNGDGQNDVLYFNLINITRLEYIRIFNRQGKRVFETTSVTEGWDGKLNGTLQPLESYTWVIKATDINGSPVIKQGTVTLLR